MEYTKEQLMAMREILWGNEFEILNEDELNQILWDGCVGYNNMPDQQIIDGFEDLYPDEKERYEFLNPSGSNYA